MKIVRSILTGAEYDCVEESENYYIGKKDADAFLYALPKFNYVIVGEGWEDVTKGCTVITNGDDIIHNGSPILSSKGYRIEKIKVEYDGGLRYAFVVKKLVKR